MRQWIALLEGKSGNFFNDSDRFGVPGGNVITIDQIVAELARRLGWKRNSPVEKYSMLWGERKVGKAFPRVFTKSNVEFVMYGVIDVKTQYHTLVVAAKRRSSSWHTSQDSMSETARGVTYLRVRISGGFDYDDLEKQVRSFTQGYKSRHANNDTLVRT